MPLYDYNVNRDHFEEKEQPLGALSFPCCCCTHGDKNQKEHPCKVCDHNLAAEREAAEAVRG